MEKLTLDDDHLCARCDAQRGINGFSVWGHVNSGEKSASERVRNMYGCYVSVKFYLCDQCIKELFQ